MENDITLKSLSWNVSKEEQDRTVNMLIEIYNNPDMNLDELFDEIKSNPCNKTQFENFCRVADGVIKSNHTGIDSLLFLLQDMNWPGANQSVNILANIEDEYLLQKLESTLQYAYETNDFGWLAGLKLLTNKLPEATHRRMDKEKLDYLQYADY